MRSMRALLRSLLAGCAVTTVLAAQEPVRVGSLLMTPTLKKQVEPVYPAAALRARVEGVVIVELKVDVTGKVTSAKVLESPQPRLLDQAAIKAVKRWVYEPTLLYGKPVPTILVVTILFKLPMSNPERKS